MRGVAEQFFRCMSDAFGWWQFWSWARCARQIVIVVVMVNVIDSWIWTTNLKKPTIMETPTAPWKNSHTSTKTICLDFCVFTVRMKGLARHLSTSSSSITKQLSMHPKRFSKYWCSCVQRRSSHCAWQLPSEAYNRECSTKTRFTSCNGHVQLTWNPLLFVYSVSPYCDWRNPILSESSTSISLEGT